MSPSKHKKSSCSDCTTRCNEERVNNKHRANSLHSTIDQSTSDFYNKKDAEQKFVDLGDKTNTWMIFCRKDSHIHVTPIENNDHNQR